MFTADVRIGIGEDGDEAEELLVIIEVCPTSDDEGCDVGLGGDEVSGVAVDSEPDCGVGGAGAITTGALVLSEKTTNPEINGLAFACAPGCTRSVW